jgi:hypothetical protein
MYHDGSCSVTGILLLSFRHGGCQAWLFMHVYGPVVWVRMRLLAAAVGSSCIAQYRKLPFLSKLLAVFAKTHVSTMRRRSVVSHGGIDAV